MADLSVTAANVVPGSGSTVKTGIIGETITAGMALYLKASDGRLWKAQADGTAAEAATVGIAMNGGSAGQPIGYVSDGLITIGATTAKTTSYMVSATAGGVAPQADLTSGQYIVHLGYATDTSGAFVVSIRNTGVVV